MKFEELNLRPELHKAVHKLGFTEATEIQAKCIPVILSGKDMVGQSQTGSGKTAAFGLPILNMIEAGKGVQSIILTPTRELCVQVHDIMRQMAQFMRIRMASVYGGVSISPQIDELRRAEIVVGTPGRVLDHLDRKTLDLSKVKIFVLDEADRMLEMGFIDDIKIILKYVSKDKQSLLFSATMPTPIKGIVQHNFKNPIFITGQKHVDKSLLKQIYYNLQPHEKFSLLVHLLNQKKGISLIFCATRNEVDVVNNNLRKQGVRTVAIHGGLTQSKRLHTVEMIKKEHVNVLVATDVAARGLDIRNIDHVYNYDLPKSSEDYTHRIGRTARAGDEGEAITLLTHADYDKFSKILSDRNIKIEKGVMPAFPMIKFERLSRDSSRGGSFRGSSYHRGPSAYRGPSEHRNVSKGFHKPFDISSTTSQDRNERRRRRERR
ncbi:TPA: DEAD/DEAH box helicase [Candidatus Woesearchaeota archaeon]|nr:DEAD/DEAH box helicase [Candidatus Woesearchaeota archaeon]